MIKREFERWYPCCIISARSEYKLGNISRPIVFCVDCIYQQTRDSYGYRCDEFVFFDLDENTGLYLIERKSGANKDMEEIKNQLQGGASFITGILRNDPALDDFKLNFMPVLVSDNLQLSSFKKLRTIKISLCDMPKFIQHVPKKTKLPKIKGAVFKVKSKRKKPKRR